MNSPTQTFQSMQHQLNATLDACTAWDLDYRDTLACLQAVHAQHVDALHALAKELDACRDLERAVRGAA